MASDTNLTAIRAAAPVEASEKTVFRILLAISFCHLLTVTVQSVIPAIYPLLKHSFHLDFGQVGLIALTLQLTASILQPLVGLYTDRRPQPYSHSDGQGIRLGATVRIETDEGLEDGSGQLQSKGDQAHLAEIKVEGVLEKRIDGGDHGLNSDSQ